MARPNVPSGEGAPHDPQAEEDRRLRRIRQIIAGLIVAGLLLVALSFLIPRTHSAGPGSILQQNWRDSFRESGIGLLTGAIFAGIALVVEQSAQRAAQAERERDEGRRKELETDREKILELVRDQTREYLVELSALRVRPLREATSRYDRLRIPAEIMEASQAMSPSAQDVNAADFAHAPVAIREIRGNTAWGSDVSRALTLWFWGSLLDGTNRHELLDDLKRVARRTERYRRQLNRHQLPLALAGFGEGYARVSEIAGAADTFVGRAEVVTASDLGDEETNFFFFFFFNQPPAVDPIFVMLDRLLAECHALAAGGSASDGFRVAQALESMTSSVRGDESASLYLRVTELLSAAVKEPEA